MDVNVRHQAAKGLSRLRIGDFSSKLTLAALSAFVVTYLAKTPATVVAYFLASTAARNRSSDSTSAGSATVSAISWRKSSRYRLRSL